VYSTLICLSLSPLDRLYQPTLQAGILGLVPPRRAPGYCLCALLHCLRAGAWPGAGETGARLPLMAHSPACVAQPAYTSATLHNMPPLAVPSFGTPYGNIYGCAAYRSSSPSWPTPRHPTMLPRICGRHTRHAPSVGHSGTCRRARKAVGGALATLRCYHFFHSTSKITP